MAKKKNNETVTFIAKCHNQLVWINAPEKPQFDAFGRRVGDPGQEIQFNDHRFTTDDPEVARALRESAVFNLTIWEDGNAPDEPKPTIKAQLEAIIGAQVKQDVDAIEKVVKVELDTHKRVVVLEAAEAALKVLAAGDGESESSPSTSDNSEPALTT